MNSCRSSCGPDPRQGWRARPLNFLPSHTYTSITVVCAFPLHVKPSPDFSVVGLAQHDGMVRRFARHLMATESLAPFCLTSLTSSIRLPKDPVCSWRTNPPPTLAFEVGIWVFGTTWRQNPKVNLASIGLIFVFVSIFRNISPSLSKFPSHIIFFVLMTDSSCKTLILTL